MRRTVFILAVIMLAMVLKPNDSFALESRKGTSDQAAKGRLMEVTFRIKGSGIDKAALESIQNYSAGDQWCALCWRQLRTVEINVSYDSVKTLRSVEYYSVLSENVEYYAREETIA